MSPLDGTPVVAIIERASMEQILVELGNDPKYLHSALWYELRQTIFSLKPAWSLLEIYCTANLTNLLKVSF